MKEIMFTVIGLAVGIMILGAGLYYLVKEKKIRNQGRFTLLQQVLEQWLCWRLL